MKQEKAKLISLIIATRNRCAQLRRCLAFISQLRCKVDWELIIVDNGSTDGTEMEIQEFINLGTCQTRVVKVPQPGKGAALNKAIPQAQGDILAFTDDDCYPRDDFLEQISQVFEDPEIGYMGGHILLYDPTDAPITIRTDTDKMLIPPRSFVPAGLIHGANMAARRSVIEAIGGFDPKLGPGTPFICEDVDFVGRASAAGWKGGYFPGPLVYHHHGRKPGEGVKKLMRTYAYGRGAYYAKFIMNRQTRRLYAKHWWWTMKLDRKEQLVQEIVGAVRYCLSRSLHSLLLSMRDRHPRISTGRKVFVDPRL